MPKPPAKPNPSPNSPASPARREAFAILLELERGQAHADDLLRGARVSTLSERDRNLCTTLVMGTLRWQIRLDASIRPLLSKPNARLDAEVRIALRMGALQLLFLDRIPVHAAIGESVALCKLAGHKFAAGMVNAVLRKLALQPKGRSVPEGNPLATELAEATAHPEWLVERWVAAYGLEDARKICVHGQDEPPLTLRLSSPEIESELAGEGISLEPGGLLTAARRVLSGDVTATEAFRSGRVRIQDEGSQLVVELAGSGDAVLDCCAAPGGKTLILAERNLQARIVACEISPGRLEALRVRIEASPYSDQIEVRLADATALPGNGAYDLVLADVPCSGTGTLGRNPEIRHRLRVEDLARQAERQRAILLSALGALRPGGRLIYSTCSLEAEENAEVVAAVLGELAEFRQVSLADRIGELRAEGRITEGGAEYLLDGVGADGALMLLPGERGSGLDFDGFFVAMIEGPM